MNYIELITKGEGYNQHGPFDSVGEYSLIHPKQNTEKTRKPKSF